MRNLLTIPFLAAAMVCAATNPAEDAVSRVKKQLAPDARQVEMKVTATILPDNSILLKGTTSEEAVHQALLNELKPLGKIVDSLVVFPTDKWALPRIAVACARTNGSHAAEMASQALMGHPLRVLERDDDWVKVQMPDGYIAWIVDNSLALKTDAEMTAWRKSPRLVVTAPYQTRIYRAPDSRGPRDVLSDAVNGNILEGSVSDGEMTQVTLPDGRTGYIASADVTPIDKWAAQDFDADRILDLAYGMEGTPYLWGGTSVKTLDCSGLAKVCYLSNGIILMRDASQQALTGEKFAPEQWRELEAGDLLFFGNPKTGKVTHVAIYDSNGDYVHSSGRVRRNSVDPESESYLTTPFLSASRIKSRLNTKGIVQAKNHPWYF